MEKQIEEAAKKKAKKFADENGGAEFGVFYTAYMLAFRDISALSQQSQQPDSKDLEGLKLKFDEKIRSLLTYESDDWNDLWNLLLPQLSPQSKPVVDTEALKQLFFNKFDCYADTQGTQNIEAMTLKTFIEVVSNLTNTSEGDKPKWKCKTCGETDTDFCLCV